jgi:hypothetical protein
MMSDVQTRYISSNELNKSPKSSSLSSSSPSSSSSPLSTKSSLTSPSPKINPMPILKPTSNALINNFTKNPTAIQPINNSSPTVIKECSCLYKNIGVHMSDCPYSQMWSDDIIMQNKNIIEDKYGSF